MPQLFKDKEHLLRLAALFAAGLLAFLLLRGLLVPPGFGDLGHFRPGALDDNRAVTPAFAGRQACAECHDDVVAQRRGSLHQQVGCESCHGPLAAHAADPGETVPERPQGTGVCLPCHRHNVARPAGFPQVDPAEHAEGSACIECHEAHHPEI